MRADVQECGGELRRVTADGDVARVADREVDAEHPLGDVGQWQVRDGARVVRGPSSVVVTFGRSEDKHSSASPDLAHLWHGLKLLHAFCSFLQREHARET